MSRTFVHTPLKTFYDWQTDPWKEEYSKHSNTKDRNYQKYSRRKLRRAIIDDDETALTNALAVIKGLNYLARDRYW